MRVPSITVKYADLDLASEAGANALYARLKRAARAACAVIDSRELWHKELYRACTNEALTAAVVKVNKSTVTALHERTLKERAS